MKSVNGWNLDASRVSSGIGGVAVGRTDFSVVADGGMLRYDNLQVPSTLTIYNISGNKVFDAHIDTAAGCLDTNLRGFHIVTVSSADGIASRKIVF